MAAAPAPPFGELIERVEFRDFSSKIAKAKITECRDVASFNWLKGPKPKIVIPGMPPRWTPLDKPVQLSEDSGEYYRDVNAMHYPSHPIEPAVRAALVQQPDLPCEEIDLFACGSTIGHLLRLALGTTHTFRFVAERIGETVFFVRRENSPTEKIMDIRGYGHSFPEQYTTWDDTARNSDSHQRMIRYNFAGFDCIVRYEGDGYLPSKAMGQREKGGESFVLPELESLSMTSGGKEVSKDAIFDLKTRSAWKRTGDVLAGELGRLWARQIPNFVLAFHQRGVFSEIQVQDVRDRVTKWEEAHQKDLRILAGIIGKVVAVVRDGREKRVEVCCRSPGVLEIRHVGGTFPNALPEDLRRVWEASDAFSDSGSESPEGVSLGDEDDDGVNSGDDDFTACSVSCGYCGRCKY